MDTNKLESVLSSFTGAAKHIALPVNAAPAFDKSFVRLHVNENPFPLPEKVAVRAAQAMEKLFLYPEEDSSSLRKAVADTYGFSKEQVIAANGSSEILSLIYRSLLSSGEKAAMVSPGFTYNRKLALLQDATLEEVKWNPDYSLPEKELTSEYAKDWKFIVIANPNNPTGTFIPPADIKRLLEKSDRLIVLDEAYVDFAPDNALSLIRQHPNLLVLRTFSKSYAAAGARIGFALGHAEVVGRLQSVQSPFNLNLLGQSIGIGILENLDAYKTNHQDIISQRDRVSAALGREGFDVLPSQTNFVFARVPTGTSGTQWSTALQEKKIIVGSFAEPSLKDYLRITVTDKEQMNMFLSAIQVIRRDFSQHKPNSLHGLHPS